MSVPGEDAMGGITHHANGRRPPFSDSTTRGFRGKTVALVDTGVVGARPVPFGRQDAVTAGERVLPAGDISVRTGTFDAVGDRIPVPLRAARPSPEENAPPRAGCPPDRRRKDDVDGAERRRSRLASGQVGTSRAATSSSCTAISVKSRSRSRVRTWKRCPVSVQVSRIGGSTAVWA